MATIYRFTTAVGATLAILAMYTTAATPPNQQATDRTTQATPRIGIATSPAIAVSPHL